MFRHMLHVQADTHHYYDVAAPELCQFSGLQIQSPRKVYAYIGQLLSI